MSDFRSMDVFELTKALGCLMQGYGKFRLQTPAHGPIYLQSQIDEVAYELRRITGKVARTKTPFFVVYILTSRLFNYEDPGHLWKNGVTVFASDENQHLAEQFRRESTHIWNRMKVLYEERGFLL